MRSILFIVFSVMLSTGVIAQRAESLGDKAFKNKSYYSAAYYYEKALNVYSSHPQIPFYTSGAAGKKRLMQKRAYLYYQIAESYRLCQDYRQAGEWYNKIITENHEPDYPLSRLWYGQCLRAQSRFDDALQQLRQFKTGWKGGPEFSATADREIVSCNFAKVQYLHPRPVKVERMPQPWNANAGDYALTKSGGDTWFTSSRPAGDRKIHTNAIYVASAQNASAPVLTNFVDDGAGKMEHGTPSVAPSSKKIYLTGWYKKDGKNILAIYASDLENGRWSPLHKLNQNVNVEGYNALQPFLTHDGKRLFFASDRPGGQGGYDIWVSELDSSGNPLNAINLGKGINTSDDEESPFFDDIHQKLVFSSKSFTGLGGFDFFESYKNNSGWSTPLNLGYPINSPKDDLYYYEDPDNASHFYISSDRDSECCLSLFEGNFEPFSISGKITACDLNTPLSQVKISLIDSVSKQVILQQETGADGGYNFKATANYSYLVKFEHSGYFTKVITPSGKYNNDTLSRTETCLQSFKVNKPIVLKNVLYDFNKASLRPESKIALDYLVTVMTDNPGLKVELSSHTDSIGSDSYNMALSQQRAQACVDYILSKGIGKERIFARSYGKTRPVAPNSLPNGNDNPAGRQLNRRTEFTIVNK